MTATAYPPWLWTLAKWVLAAIIVVVVAVVLYLGAVLSVYVLAWILDLIGLIFD
jgi:hypothetical protein